MDNHNSLPANPSSQNDENLPTYKEFLKSKFEAIINSKNYDEILEMFIRALRNNIDLEFLTDELDILDNVGRINEALDSEGRTPLIFAIIAASETGSTKLVKYLAKKEDLNINQYDHHKRTPISYCENFCENNVGGVLDKIKRFLERYSTSTPDITITSHTSTTGLAKVFHENEGRS